MKNIVIAAVLSVVLPLQANALSCLRPDVAVSFSAASAAPERYAAIYGTFGFIRSQTAEMVPPGLDGQAPAPFEVRFSGKGLSAGGFVDVAPRDITVVITCAGPWCGSFIPNVETLAFVQRTADGDVLNIGPCPQWVFPQPSRADIATVEACMRGEPCESSQHR